MHETGYLPVSPYFPRMFIQNGTYSTAVIFSVLLSRFSFESYKIKQNINLFLSATH